MCVFLRIYPQLEILTKAVVSTLEARIRAAEETGDWASLCVGDIFMGLKPLASTYASYAAACEEATNILAQKEFTEYVNAVRPGLLPLTLSQHLQAPFDAMNRYQVQLQALLEETRPGHPDYEVGIPPSVHPFIHRFIHPPTNPPTHQPTQSIHPSTNPPTHHPPHRR